MFNQATLVGNVGRDPEIRSTQNGTRLASFSLATTETWKDRSGERKERVDWHNIVVWNEGLVGVVERFVHKGSKLMVQGKIQTRKWQDQQGQDRYTTEIVLQGFDATIKLLDDRNSGTGGGGSRSSGGGSASRGSQGSGGGGGSRGGRDDDLDSEIPF